MAGSKACCDVRIDAEARAGEAPVVTSSTGLRSVHAAESNRDDQIVSWTRRGRVDEDQRVSGPLGAPRQMSEPAIAPTSNTTPPPTKTGTGGGAGLTSADNRWRAPADCDLRATGIVELPYQRLNVASVAVSASRPAAAGQLSEPSAVPAYYLECRRCEVHGRAGKGG